jgi:hypothetical protein
MWLIHSQLPTVRRAHSHWAWTLLPARRGGRDRLCGPSSGPTCGSRNTWRDRCVFALLAVSGSPLRPPHKLLKVAT